MRLEMEISRFIRKSDQDEQPGDQASLVICGDRRGSGLDLGDLVWIRVLLVWMVLMSFFG